MFESVRICKMLSETCKVTCYIYFCKSAVNLMFKITSSSNIEEGIDFEQRKVGFLHRLPTLKAASSTSTANNER